MNRRYHLLAQLLMSTSTMAVTLGGGAAPVDVAPSNSTAPAISGTPQVGSLLTSSTGVWSGSPTPTYAYQWNRAGTAISGQTGATYTVVTADIGQNITVTVTATNTAGSASATSAAVVGQAASTFSPSSLFAASEPGAWYDPSDIERYTATTGPELVTNGDFSSGATGWTATAATVLAVSGGLEVTSTGTAGRIVQNISTVVGKAYRFECSYTPNAGDRAMVSVRAPNDFGPVMTGLSSATFTAGTFVGFFVATSTTAAIRLQAFDTGDVVLFDNVSVKEAPEFGTATMFQDIVGTVPVTGVGQPVGLIWDKSRTINRGVNLVSNGTFTTNTTGWTALASSIASVSGELEVTGSGGSYPRAEQAYTLVVGKTYRMSATVRKGTANGNAYISYTSGPYVDTTSTTNTTLTMVFTATNTSGLATCGIFSGAGTGTAYFDNFVVEEVSPADAFQATAAARPVLQQEAGGQYYLAFDGTDDFLATSNINLAATNKVTVFAGVRKLSDAVTGTIIETTTNFASNAGAFQITAPGGTSGDYRFYFRGDTASPGMAATTFTAPITNVLTCSYDIAGPDRASEILPRINGAIPTLTGLGSGTNQAGNFGNYAAYIGARSTSANRLTGRLYSLIVLGRAATAGEITDAETWVNGKTGAY